MAGAAGAAGEEAAGGPPGIAPSKTLEVDRAEKMESMMQVTAKRAAVHRVIVCAKVVAPVAPRTEFDPPPPKAPPKEPLFES